jgi:hypothetical protein
MHFAYEIGRRANHTGQRSEVKPAPRGGRRYNRWSARGGQAPSPLAQSFVWRPSVARPIVVTLAGAGSRSGRAPELFDSVQRYLAVAGGYRPEDFIEASYRVESTGAPIPYDETDAVAPLAVSTRAVANTLRWLRRRAPTRIHLLGWSLGGVVLFEAAVAFLDADPTWAQTLGSIVTLASPLLGSDVDGIDLLGSLAAGAAGADLSRRAADEQEKRRVRQDAARLRGAGIRLVTLAAEDDAVVTPADSLLPALGPETSAYILRPKRRPNGTYVENVLGHGNLPYDPVCWRRVLEALGPAGS